MEITRHFTATAFIVYKRKVLLHLHKKLKCWLPIGGHIDRDELPETTVVREVMEETGLKISLYNPDISLKFGADAIELHRPMHLLLENINEYHQHIDFIYFATTNSNKLTPQHGESNNLKWYSESDLAKLKNAPNNVVVLAREAIDIFKT